MDIFQVDSSIIDTISLAHKHARTHKSHEHIRKKWKCALENNRSIYVLMLPPNHVCVCGRQRAPHIVLYAMTYFETLAAARNRAEYNATLFA